MKTSTHFLLMFFGIIFMSVYPPGHFFGIEFEVRVINGFSNNSSLPLVIWCVSQQDEDMGGRALQESDDYGWRVKTNLWGSSDYLCTLKWDRKRRSFEGFKVGRDSQRCGSLNKRCWVVREDGFYFSRDEV
ncbi:S-protein homolog 5-like [Hibiscus syriacus]|uniref:S-protein homolog 5-like n=1 Tax=Hibiscus syriacus TaxID=106335 RepID=UPI001923FFBD|nr:S-protein homolog 5-like [Hibiscus syriacus]